MGTVSATLEIPYATSAVEALWYDPQRWPAFVDGFGHLQSVDEGWPQTGTRAVWDTPPGGRGRVRELVEAHEPRARCVTAVEDETIRGTQTVTFTPHEGGTSMKVQLKYEIKERSALTPVIDLLFIRRAQTQSLQRTLYRFGLELRGDHELAA